MNDLSHPKCPQQALETKGNFSLKKEIEFSVFIKSWIDNCFDKGKEFLLFIERSSSLTLRGCQR